MIYLHLVKGPHLFEGTPTIDFCFHFTFTDKILGKVEGSLAQLVPSSIFEQTHFQATHVVGTTGLVPFQLVCRVSSKYKMKSSNLK